MKNWEKYEEELKSVGTTSFGITHYGKKVLNCDDMHCSGCIFNKDNLWGDSRLCGYDKMRWLFKDYEEPQPKLTKKEKAFVDAISNSALQIRRNREGELYLDIGIASVSLNPDMFPFIDCGWFRSISDLKKLEVENED